MDNSGGSDRPEVAGIILCGGRSLRMGREKASLPLGERTLIEILAGRMADCCRPLVVVGHSGQAELAPAGTSFVVDELEDAGPLAGMAAGLSFAAEHTGLAQLAACDTPFFVAAVTQLLARRIGDASAAIPCDGQHIHGLSGLYRTAIAPQLRQFLADGVRRVRDLPGLLPVQLVPLDEIAAVDPSLVSFRGANTPDEYAGLIQIWNQR